jgi:hypothetical protein
MRRLTYGLGLLAVLLLTGCPGKKPAPAPVPSAPNRTKPSTKNSTP